MNADDDMEITLPILRLIEQKSDITQRSLAKQLGLALGLTNSYLKYCINKGLVKIEQIPANRYLYYLTPKGFAEKSRLTAEFLTRSFHFYRQASASCFHLFKRCLSQGYKEAILCGVSDLTDIALLQASRTEVQVLGIYDPSCEHDLHLKYQVWHEMKAPLEHAVFVITALNAPKRMRIQLQQTIDDSRVVAPDILSL